MQQLGQVLLDEGVRFMEVTLTTPGALEAIAQLQSLRGDGLRIGAGTVLTTTDAEAAIHAGVDFIVSPTVEPDVVAVAHEPGHAAIIGGLTPDGDPRGLARRRRHREGVPGPGRDAGILCGRRRSPADIPLMPTGNVDLETAPAYFRAGAIAVGVGKALVNPDYLRTGQFDLVRADVARWRQLVG